jgi:hypothetical protein
VAAAERYALQEAPPLGYNMTAAAGTFCKRSVLSCRIRRTSFRRDILKGGVNADVRGGSTHCSREKMRMRIIFVSAVVLLSALATPAAAKGCLKGAVVGGVVGHYARHHGVIGAAVGCLVGRHQAKKRARAQQHTLLQHDRGGQSD